MYIENIPDKYSPTHADIKACESGEFIFASAYLDHGHIYSMTSSLVSAGGVLKYVYDGNIERARALASKYPGAVATDRFEDILEDRDVMLVAAAAVTSERADVGIRVMMSGKDYFTDKAPLTTLGQLGKVRETIAATKRKYFVYYSERVASECAEYAGQLIKAGAIGRVLSVDGLGPHRLGEGRPDWFFKRDKYGGILCDIGSHQIEQFLFYTDNDSAEVTYAYAANFAHPEHPEFNDFGEACLVGGNGASDHFRVDWFTPSGLGTWGDGRLFILGTDGYIEMRKYIDVGTGHGGGQIYLVDGSGEYHIDAVGKIGVPYINALIRDCINRTESAMTQEHALLAAELCVRAQMMAENTK